MRLSKIGGLLPAQVRPLARRPLVRYRFRGLQPTDAVLVSYPKSGSTWLRFLMAQAMTGHEVDYDAIRDTMPPVGRHRRAPSLLPTGGRVARTHEPMQPWRGKPEQPVIYLVRDGRDVCMSYFNHVRRQGQVWELPAFAEAFIVGGVDGYGPWHEHARAGLEAARATPASMLVLRYEELRADPVVHLGNVLSFLGIDTPARDLEEVVAANQAEHMRAKAATSAFLSTRGGSGTQVTDSRPWGEALAPDLRRRFMDVCGAALDAVGYSLADGGLRRPGPSI